MPAVQLEPKPRYAGTITFDGATVHQKIDRGSVLVNGRKASILSFDEVMEYDGEDKPIGVRRRTDVDVLRNVTVELLKHGQVRISGESLFAVQHQQLSGDDAIISLVVDESKGCKGCR